MKPSSFFGILPHLRALSRDEHHHPRHDQDYARPNGRPEVGLHTRNADLAEDRRQACEHSRSGCVQKPASARFGRPSGLFLLDHQMRACRDADHADPARPAQRFVQKQHRQQNGQYRAGLVDRHDLVHVADLQGPEIAEPARAGCQARQHQKQQRPAADLCQLRLRPNEKDHPPRKRQHHDCPDGGRDR